MRKTLLIAAAALAASVISSEAQVYSQNIVGYVNQIVPNNFSTINNPLDNPNGNSATNLFDTTSGNNDGSILFYWNGTGFTQVEFASGTVYAGQPSGFVNALTLAPVAAPVLNPGTGYFFNNSSGNGVFTNTFVGTVHVDGAPTGTQTVGSTTNVLNGAAQFVFIASKLPIGGGIASSLGLTNDLAGDLDGSILYIPNIVSGQVHGYAEIEYSSGAPSGFVNALTLANVAEPTIPVGGAFLFNNAVGANWNWVQSY
jgi:hypothetical protein